MTQHSVVAHQEWLKAREAFLAKEKEFTRLRDELSRQRRELPWEKVEKTYVFEGPDGKSTLSDLFAGKSQLIVHHFMFHPDWSEGCKSCSFWADQYDGIDIHLKHRDVSLVAISRAPYEKLAAYKKRMGWRFPWVSCVGNGFNNDYYAAFTPEQLAGGTAYFNYAFQKTWGEDVVGMSVFMKDADGGLFHTYSSYSRGVDILNAAYNFIDLTPKGRDEGGKNQAWVRRHDQYED